MSLSRFHRAFHRFGGGTFGWTEVQAQMIIVDRQLQIIPNKDRGIGVLEFGGVSARSIDIGAASALSRK